MRVALVIAEGIHRGREIVIAGPRFVVGRNPDCQLRSKSAAVSKQHFEITVEDDHVWVTDLMSTNGTQVNGHSLGVDSVELADGDRLQAGPLVFIVRLTSAAAAAAEATLPEAESTLPAHPPVPEASSAGPTSPPTGVEEEIGRTAVWSPADGETPDEMPEVETPAGGGGTPARPVRPAPRTARMAPQPPKTLEGTAKAADELLKRLIRPRKPFPPGRG